MTNAAANAVLTAEPALFALLSTTPIAADGTGATEPAQPDYVRPAISFAAAAGRARVSTNLAKFVSGATAVGSAGTFIHIGLATSATPGAGIIRWEEALAAPLAWVVGQPVEIPAGNIVIELQA